MSRKVASAVVALIFSGLSPGAPESVPAGSPEFTAEQPGLRLEALRNASSARLLLVRNSVRTGTAIMPDSMETMACKFQGEGQAAVSALIDELAKSFNSSWDAGPPGLLVNTRTEVIFLSDQKVMERIYVLHANADENWPVAFHDGIAWADSNIRSRLEHWASRPDVKMTGLPDSAVAIGMTNYPCFDGQ